MPPFQIKARSGPVSPLRRNSNGVQKRTIGDIVTQIAKPAVRPADPRFSAGPTRKRPGWSLDALSDAALGRSHRSALGKAKLKEVIDLSREILGLPDDYHIGIVPASDTGAVEMAMWSLLGERGVDVAAWENFGQAWVTDADKQLPLKDLRLLTADYGDLPDLSQYLSLIHI